MTRELNAEKFGKKLAAMRNKAGLSLRELAKKSGVSFSLIGGIENCRRAAGKRSLYKLGTCFGLHGKELEEFTHEGLVGSGRDKLLDHTKKYPAPVYNLLARRLSDAGVSSLTLTDVIVPDPERPLPKVLCGNCHANSRNGGKQLNARKNPDLILRARDGALIVVEIKMSRR